MRYIDRNTVSSPPSLTAPEGLAQKEQKAARRYYQVPQKKAYKFRAYKADDVVDALNKLFHGKCAYCESKTRATQPTDIEHFRPKGGVDQCPGHPGYWWLAGSWDNLLPSCIDCNRCRFQLAYELPDTSGQIRTTGKYKLGKGNNFPILGSQYAKNESECLDAEKPALIDPTKSKPEDHLKWLEIEGKSLIGPRDANGTIDPYGFHSYHVFGLNRQGLVEERTELYLHIKKGFMHLRKLIFTSLKTSDPKSAMEISDTASQMLEDLKSLALPHQPYSAMVEALVKEEISSLKKTFEQIFEP